MIKLIAGSIGGGKSVSVVKEIIDRGNPCYVNFNMKHENVTRLKISHIIKDDIKGYKKDGTAIMKKAINWEFWNEHKEDGFDIYIDETHNIAHSRRSMTTWNTLFSIWLAQIRKILGESKKYNLYLITQKIERVDIAARDLAQEIIYVSKLEDTDNKVKTKIWNSRIHRYDYKMLPGIWIRKFYFRGNYCLEKFYSFLSGSDTADYSTYFYSNGYFKFYDSLEILNFGEEIYL